MISTDDRVSNGVLADEPEYSESDEDIDIDAAMDFTQALSLTRPTEQTYGMQGHYMKERVMMRAAARERFAEMYYKKEGNADDLTLWFDPDSTTADPVRAGMGLEVKRAEVDDNGDFVNANAVVKGEFIFIFIFIFIYRDILCESCSQFDYSLPSHRSSTIFTTSPQSAREVRFVAGPAPTPHRRWPDSD